MDECRIPSTHLTFLYAGKLEPKNGMELLDKAFLSIRHPFLRLIIVGNGVLKRQMTFYAERSNHIHFIDFQNQSMMPVVYKLCHVFILPSTGPGETWGLSVIGFISATFYSSYCMPRYSQCFTKVFLAHSSFCALHSYPVLHISWFSTPNYCFSMGSRINHNNVKRINKTNILGIYKLNKIPVVFRGDSTLFYRHRTPTGFTNDSQEILFKMGVQAC